VRTGIDQREAGHPFLHADQQRTETVDAPIALKARKRGIAALIVELQVV
jgi:hypothetical protein